MKHQIQPPPDLRAAAARRAARPGQALRADAAGRSPPTAFKRLARSPRCRKTGWSANDPSLDGPPLKDIKRRKIVAEHTISEKGFAAEKLLADLLAQRALTSLQAEIISGQRYASR